MNLREQSLHCLKVYLERLRRVLNAMDSGQVDRALEKLRRVDAAFHNFKSLEFRLFQLGIDIAQEESALWREAEETNQVLQQRLLDLRKQLNDEMIRSRRTKAGISKYRSGRQLQAEIEQGI